LGGFYLSRREKQAREAVFRSSEVLAERCTGINAAEAYHKNSSLQQEIVGLMRQAALN
jgi:hypothetical protein